VDLTDEYQVFEISFTSTSFNGPVNDARLRFWFVPFAQAGDVSMIDDVSLRKESTVMAASPDEGIVVDDSDSDDTGRLEGGPVPEEDATDAIQHVFMPLIAR
jgi:hypothetical protein